MLTQSQHHQAADHSISALPGNNLGSSGTSIINMVAAPNTPCAYSCPLIIPSDGPSPNGQYTIMVNTSNYIGWSVQLSCDHNDANGQPISFGAQAAKITVSPDTVGVNVTLEPGFDAMLTVTMYPNGLPQQPGASMTLSCAYEVSSNAKTPRGKVNPKDYVVLGSCTWANPMLG
jgi:hypothetical protein